MVADGTYTAVLDRFETTQDDRELAVLLLEAGGEVVEEVLVEREALPVDGRHPDAVFDVTVDDALTTLEYRSEESRERTEAAQSRFDRLARRPPDDDETSE